MVDSASPSDDAQLMREIAQGDRAALAELVRRHQRRALQVAYRTTGNRSLAEDVAQDAFIRVWQASEAYAPSSRFSTWFYRIVVNLSLDALKKKRPVLRDPPADLAGGNAPSDSMEGDETIERVRRAVAALPERQRVALVLHRYSGLPVRSISDATGWSESAVESLLVRAYASLRKELSERPE